MLSQQFFTVGVVAECSGFLTLTCIPRGGKKIRMIHFLLDSYSSLQLQMSLFL